MAEKLIIEVDLETGDTRQTFNKIKREAGKAGDEAGSSFSDGFKNALSTAGGFLAAQAISTAIAGIRNEIGRVVQSAQDFEVLETRFKTLTGSVEAATRQIQGLQQFAATTPFEFNEVADAAAQLLAFNLQAEQVVPALRQLGDVASGAGANINELTVPFGRLIASQKLTLIELDKFGDRGINIIGEIGKATNQTFAQVREDISKGIVPFEEFNNALTRLTSEGGAFFESTQAQSQTLAGTISTLSSNIDLFRASFGAAFSPVLRALVLSINTAFVSLNETIGNVDFTGITEGVISFGRAVNNFIIAPLELTFNVVSTTFNAIVNGVQTVVAAVGQATGAVGDLLNSFGVDNALTQGLQDFRDTSAAVLEETSQNLKQSFGDVFDGTVFSGGDEFLSNLSNNIQSAKQIIDESGIKGSADPFAPSGENASGEVASPQESIQNFTDLFSSAFEQISFGAESLGDQFKSFQTDAVASAKTIKNSLIRNFGSAFQAVGRAIASGQNAFDAFTDVLKGALGDLASAAGDFFIKQGIGYLATPGGQGIGAALISAGVGLKVLSGVLGAQGGGGAGAAGTPADPIATDDVGGFATEDDALETQGQSVQLVVQGDVLDSDETGTRLLQILNDNFENNGGSFNEAAFV